MVSLLLCLPVRGRSVVDNRLSVTKAARLAGVSRSAFYSNYLQKGVISRSKDARGRVYIELSELLRVFPDLRQDGVVDTEDSKDNSLDVHSAQKLTSELDAKDREIQRLTELLEDRQEEWREREEWLKNQIEHYQRLLEHRPDSADKTSNEKRRKSLLGRVFDAVRDQ